MFFNNTLKIVEQKTNKAVQRSRGHLLSLLLAAIYDSAKLIIE
jgi:hypothetical protein